MFIAGWVHRDISSGNLLWCDIEGKKNGILSDLEYAKEYKPFGDESSVDPKTVSSAPLPPVWYPIINMTLGDAVFYGRRDPAGSVCLRRY